MGKTLKRNLSSWWQIKMINGLFASLTTKLWAGVVRVSMENWERSRGREGRRREGIVLEQGRFC